MKPKMVKKSTFMDNPPFESTGFYEAENCAILPKKIFSTKCMNPIIPGRPKIFIISTLKRSLSKGPRIEDELTDIKQLPVNSTDQLIKTKSKVSKITSSNNETTPFTRVVALKSRCHREVVIAFYAALLFYKKKR